MKHLKLNLSGHRNPALEQAGFLWLGCLQVDLGDPELPQKISSFLAEYVDSGDRVTVALPGLSALSALIIASILGLSGQLPSIQTILRDEQGEFGLGPVHDLNQLRTQVARRHRSDIIHL